MIQEYGITFSVRHIRPVLRIFLISVIIALSGVTSSRAETSADTAANKAVEQKRLASAVAVIHCEYAPVSFWDKATNTPSGFLVDVVDRVAAHAGLQINYICKNGWDEMLAAVDSGEADLSALLWSRKREEKLLFSTPIDTTYLSFFARSQSNVNPAGLPGDNIVGLVKGSMSYEQLKDRPGVRLQIYGSYREGLFGLLSGEVSLFAGEDSMVLKQMRETHLEDRVRKVGKPFVERKRCLVVRKDNVQLLGLLNKTLVDFVSGPEYQQIYLKWYGTPEPYWTNRRVLTASGIFVLIALGGIAFWRYVSITRINAELVRTIDKRTRAEESLRKSEEKLRAYLDNISDTIWLIDADLNMVYISPGVTRMLNILPEDLLDHPSSLLIHPDDLGVVTGAQRYVMAHPGEPHTVQYRVRNKTGNWIHVESTGINMMDNPAVNGVLVAMRDITERRQAEMKLRESENFIRNILDTVDEGFIAIDRDFRILTANKAYCSQVAESCDTVIGRHCYEISHRTLRPCYEEGEECAVRHVFETGEPHTALHKHPDARGSILYVETKAFPIKDSSGAVTSVIETVNNITEKYLLEEEQLKTQKLEAIGTLAGGIAHDFNNLLQGIFGYIAMAKLTLDQKDKSLHMLEQAEKALQMSVDLTTQLLTFSKGGSPVKKKIQLESVIENSVKFALSGSRAEYCIMLEEDLFGVEADEGQVGQVIQNIVLNADQAMPLGGMIMIAARNLLSLNKGMPHLPRGGKYVEISVRDSGSGIAAPYLRKIFDPYFTTKEKGSGLGLATSYSIIRNHGGFIDVTSEPGKGSTFIVCLPAIEAGKEALAAPAVAQASHKGKILVMDDEEMIRNIAGEMIKALGHDVDFASCGETAIEKYEAAKKAGNPFDIVILDLTIRGGLGGKETLEKLLAIDPGIRAIVSSGYSDDAVISDYHNYGFKSRLAKPYKIGELRNMLNSLLNA